MRLVRLFQLILQIDLLYHKAAVIVTELISQAAVKEVLMIQSALQSRTSLKQMSITGRVYINRNRDSIVYSSESAEELPVEILVLLLLLIPRRMRLSSLFPFTVI
jgi:hypothetical protein